MLQRIWYFKVKIYITVVLFFFFKKKIIVGVDNIPKKGAVLLVSNHKNALIDPLLIATSTKRNIHFLTRASAFKITFVKWLLSTVNMLPIYRMRDGKESLAKNEEIFNKCYSILQHKKCLLIFPEGTHDIRRLIRPLSKGFTRIVFGFLEKHPDTDLHIVPIGLNYTDATKFAESVSLYFGKPMLANSFYNAGDINSSTLGLKNAVSVKMKELTAHIDSESYEKTIQQLGNINFLDPYQANEYIKSIPEKKPEILKDKKVSPLWKFLKGLVIINSIIPYLLYKKIEPGIKEPEFISTTKFAIGASAFPLFYLLQALLVNHFFGWQTGVLYLITSVFLVLILVKTK